MIRNHAAARPLALPLAAATASIAVLAAPASALIVTTWDGTGTPSLTNTTPPPDDPGWAQLGDNRTGVYLGDHWVITADHAAGEGTFQIAGGTFPLIPGTIEDLDNPATFGRVLDSKSDIRLYRIGVDTATGLSPEDLDPSIRTVKIADSLASTNETLTIFGRGRRRITNQANDATGTFYFNSSGSFVTTPTPGFSLEGFRVNSTPPEVWQWGQNRRVSPSSIGGVRRSGNNLLIEASNLRDTVGFGVTFNENGLDDEAQGAGADSGGPVFWHDGDEWVLAGLMHAVLPENNNLSLLGAFGSHTLISDFSYSTYNSQIDALRDAPEYSVIGDLDLDGSITGEIINGEATGDLGILVDNWLSTFSEANIHSWMAGDLNQDAIVDLNDFVMLRDALGGEVQTSTLAALLQSAALPEPSGFVVALGFLAAAARTRR